MDNNELTLNMQQGGLPAAAPTMDEQTPVPMNVQTGQEGLIDDIADSSGASAPLQSNSGVKTLSEARDLFAALLNGGDALGGTPTPQMAENPLQTEINAPQTAPMPQEAPVLLEPTPSPVMQPEAKPSFAPDENTLRSMLQEELQRAMKTNPTLANEDLSSQLSDTVANPTSEAPTYEMPDFESDEFYAKFSDDPGKAIMEVAEAIAGKKNAEMMQRLQPLLDQSDRVAKNTRVQNAIKEFADRGYNDFGQHRNEMAQILKQGNFDMEDPNAYELAYNKAKVNSLQSMNEQLKATQGRTLADYMQDDGSVGQMAQNEKVKQAVINEYLKSLSQGEKPHVITDGVGSTPNAHSTNRAKDFKQAGDLFKNML